jgi:AraC-like DNA-binding protein
VRSRRIATVLTWVVPHLLEHVGSRGYDATQIRLLPGLRGRDLDDPDTRISDTTAVEAWRLAELVTGDDALGLHMAQAIPAGALDLLEYAFRSSPTLDVGLKQLARYAHAVADRAAPVISATSDGVAVMFGPTTQRQRTEFGMSFVIRIAREATGTPLVPLEVHFAHNSPEHLFEHRAFFRARLQYEEPSNQLLIARSDLMRPLRTADPALSGVVCRRLEKMLKTEPQDDSTAASVRRALLESLARGEPSAAATGRELGLSERTLHRRLRAEQTSFRNILDTVRGELAAALLREPRVGIAEISFLLGYSEPAAFYRSFRRWTGQTPLAFRRASRAT